MGRPVFSNSFVFVVFFCRKIIVIVVILVAIHNVTAIIIIIVNIECSKNQMRFERHGNIQSESFIEISRWLDDNY